MKTIKKRKKMCLTVSISSDVRLLGGSFLFHVQKTYSFPLFPLKSFIPLNLNEENVIIGDFNVLPIYFSVFSKLSIMNMYYLYNQKNLQIPLKKGKSEIQDPMTDKLSLKKKIIN